MMRLICLLCCIPLFLRSEENIRNRLDLLGFPSPHEILLPRTDRNIRIEVSVFEIELLMRGEAVLCKGSVDGVEVGWVIHCAHCHQLQLSAEEMMSGKINLFDHLVELMPQDGEVIGLVTWQNGINNTSGDFRRISNAVIQRLPEGTLGIGLYNPTEGLTADLFRVCRELAGIETAIVARTRYVMTALIDLIFQTNPDMLWTHICHSEGGLIAGNSIEGMSDEQHRLLNEHLICISLGSVFPISNDHTRATINYYSEHDYLTRHWGESYFYKPNYCIRVIECLTPLTELDAWAGDHIFPQATYQYALESAIQELRNCYGFYMADGAVISAPSGYTAD